MEAFLPSEIGRLIYGYLFRQCGENLADEFLNSCDSMRECRLLKKKYAKNFHYKVQDLSLEDILNQYSVLCSLIFENTNGEEPVHRNVLNLLQKILSFKVGTSKSTSNQQAQNDHPVVVNEKITACCDEPENLFNSKVNEGTSDQVHSAHAVVVNEQMSVLCDMRETRYDSAIDEGIASDQALSAHPLVMNEQMSVCCDESENRYDSAADEGIVFSPSNSVEEDDNNALVDEIKEKNSLLGDSSAMVVDVPSTDVNLGDEFLRNLSSSSECRLLDQVVLSSPSAKSTEEYADKVKPLPSRESVPNKPEMISTPSGAIISPDDVSKMKNLVSAAITNERPTTIDNASNNFLSVAECLPLTEFECSALNAKSTGGMVEQDAVLLPDHSFGPRKSSVISTNTAVVSQIKAPGVHPIVAPTVTASEASVSDVPITTASAAAVAVLPASVATLLTKTVTVGSTSAVAVSSKIVSDIVVAGAPTTTAPVTCVTAISMSSAVSVSEVPAKISTADGLFEIPTTTAHMTSGAETPTTIASVASVPEVSTSIVSSVASVFGDLSFASECSLSAELDESTSSVKSTYKAARKEKILPVSGKQTPKKVDPVIRSATENTPRKSELMDNLSAAKLTPKKSKVGVTSATAAATLTDEVTKSNSSDDELPWDLKLRLFVASDSLVDAHITKRKPVDFRSKRRKETPKKRKHNDPGEDQLFSSDAKRFKPDTISAAATTTTTTTASAAPHRKSVASKLAEIDNVEPNPNSSRHRRRAKDSVVAVDGDTKTARSKKTKSKSENKIVSEPVATATSFISMTDIIDFGDPLTEKRKRSAIVEKKPQPMGSTKKTAVKKLREPMGARSTQPAVSVNDGIDSNDQSAYKKRNDRVETPIVENGNRNIVDQKNSTFKQPNLPHPRESDVLSSKKPTSTHNNRYKRVETDECGIVDATEAIEMLKDPFQPSINEKPNGINESRYNDDLDFEMVLEISPEFELFSKVSRC